MDILDKCKKCIFCKETSNTGDNYCDSLKFCVGFNQFISKENAVDKIKPNYYHKGNVDTIKFCLENNLDFLQGNIVKYVVRYKEKNGIEDLEKAKEYLERLIESEQEKA